MTIVEKLQIQIFAHQFSLRTLHKSLDLPYLCNPFSDFPQILESELIFWKVYEQKDDANWSELVLHTFCKFLGFLDLQSICNISLLMIHSKTRSRFQNFKQIGPGVAEISRIQFLHAQDFCTCILDSQYLRNPSSDLL